MLVVSPANDCSMKKKKKKTYSIYSLILPIQKEGLT